MLLWVACPSQECPGCPHVNHTGYQGPSINGEVDGDSGEVVIGSRRTRLPGEVATNHLGRAILVLNVEGDMISREIAPHLGCVTVVAVGPLKPQRLKDVVAFLPAIAARDFIGLSDRDR